MAIKLKLTEALVSEKIPAKVKTRLREMQKGVFKSGNALAVPLGKAGSLGLEKPSYEVLKAYAEERGVSFEEKDMPRVRINVGSTEFLDQDGDIVRQNFDFETFKANPAMPYCHDWEQLPVGVHLHEEIKTIKTKEYEGPALIFTSLYAGAEGGQLSGEVFEAVDKGRLKGNSIGFQPTEITWPENAEERKAMGLGPFGIEVNESKLLECSPCLIPSNPLSLVEAKANGEISKAGFGLILESIKEQAEKTKNKEWEEVSKTYSTLAKALFPETDFTKSLKEVVMESLAKTEKDNSSVKTLGSIDLDTFIVQYEKVITRLNSLEKEVKTLNSKMPTKPKTFVDLLKAGVSQNNN